MKIYSIISQVEVIGYIWMPRVICATIYKLSSYDIENIVTTAKHLGTDFITREAVEQWLIRNSGDFSEVVDFSVTIGDGDFNSTWEKEESEYTFIDCMYPVED